MAADSRRSGLKLNRWASPRCCSKDLPTCAGRGAAPGERERSPLARPQLTQLSTGADRGRAPAAGCPGRGIGADCMRMPRWFRREGRPASGRAEHPLARPQSGPLIGIVGFRLDPSDEGVGGLVCACRGRGKRDATRKPGVRSRLGDAASGDLMHEGGRLPPPSSCQATIRLFAVWRHGLRENNGQPEEGLRLRSSGFLRNPSVSVCGEEEKKKSHPLRRVR
jgi:hypothetical protein